jgi:hypothetical protein
MPISISSAGRRWCCSGCSTAPYFRPWQNQLAAVHFALYNLGAMKFLAGIPLAQAHQTVVLAAFGSLLVLVGMLTFLANYYLNAFRKPGTAA